MLPKRQPAIIAQFIRTFGKVGIDYRDEGGGFQDIQKIPFIEYSTMLPRWLSSSSLTHDFSSQCLVSYEEHRMQLSTF